MEPIEVYVHHQPSGIGKCARTDKQPCNEIRMSDTNGYTFFSPSGIETILNYLDLLKCKIEGGCKNVMSAGSSKKNKGVRVTPKDIEKIKKQIEQVQSDLDEQMH